MIDFNEQHITVLLYNMLCSMNFVHTADLIHRDIKPANILVDSNCQVKICDFGFSRMQPSDPLISQNGIYERTTTKFITSPKS